MHGHEGKWPGAMPPRPSEGPSANGGLPRAIDCFVVDGGGVGLGGPLEPPGGEGGGGKNSWASEWTSEWATWPPLQSLFGFPASRLNRSLNSTGGIGRAS